MKFVCLAIGAVLGLAGTASGASAAANRDILRSLFEYRKRSGSEEYRIRVGDYRGLYEIEDAVLRVLVVGVGRRPYIERST